MAFRFKRGWGKYGAFFVAQGQNRSLRLRLCIDRDQVDAGSDKVTCTLYKVDTG